MDFLSQYENPQLIAEGETRTFRARQTATQRPVLLHQLSSNPKSGRQLHLLALVLRYTSSVRPGSASSILGIEEHGESVWVVTEDLPELADLWGWMEKQAGKKAEPAARPVMPGVTRPLVIPGADSTEPTNALDEKTVLFATRLAAADSSPVVALDAPETQAEERKERRDRADPARTARFSEAPAAPGDAIQFFSEQPGEFTRVFEAPAATDAPPEVGLSDATISDADNESTVILPRPAADVPAEAVTPADSGFGSMDPSAPPGEFTMLFRRAPNGAGPGEPKGRFLGFTAPTQEKAKFIETAPIPAPPAREPAGASPGPQAATQTPQSGETTAAFGAPVAPREPTAFSRIPDLPALDDPLRSPPPGEFTEVFGRTQPARDPGTPEREEPGAFTRIFQIPVGSDLLIAVESGTVVSRPPASATPGRPAETPPAPPSGEPPAPAAVTPVVPPGAAGEAAKPIAPSAPIKPFTPPVPKFEASKPPPLVAPKVPAIAAPKAPALPESAAAAPSRSLLPLILIFGGIVLVAVLIVLFFVTKR